MERISFFLAQIDVKDSLVADFHKTGKAMKVFVGTQFKLSWVGALLGWAGANSTITIASTTTMRNE